MARPTGTIVCDECGAEMELDESWSSTTPPIPIIGKEVEYAEFACPECRSKSVFKRTESGDGWQRESTRPFS